MLSLKSCSLAKKSWQTRKTAAVVQSFHQQIRGRTKYFLISMIANGIDIWYSLLCLIVNFSPGEWSLYAEWGLSVVYFSLTKNVLSGFFLFTGYFLCSTKQKHSAQRYSVLLFQDHWRQRKCRFLVGSKVIRKPKTIIGQPLSMCGSWVFTNAFRLPLSCTCKEIKYSFNSFALFTIRLLLFFLFFVFFLW